MHPIEINKSIIKILDFNKYFLLLFTIFIVSSFDSTKSKRYLNKILVNIPFEETCYSDFCWLNSDAIARACSCIWTFISSYLRFHMAHIALANQTNMPIPNRKNSGIDKIRRIVLNIPDPNFFLEKK